jgi:hypothetical protein
LGQTLSGAVARNDHSQICAVLVGQTLSTWMIPEGSPEKTLIIFVLFLVE